MNNFYLLLSGVLIGTGVVLPGVSGSVIAILMGVYDYIILLLNDSKLNAKDKVIKLLPIIIGLIIGIIIFGNILLILYDIFQYEMMYIFMGFILGEVPLLQEKVERRNGKKINKIYTFISIIISFIVIVLPKMLNLDINNSFNPFNLFIAGFLYISGKIIPGVSSSLFLMILGLYEYILHILSNPFSLTVNQIILLIPFILGMLFGFLTLIKLINYMINNFFSKTYSVIIGFVIGSVFAIYPGFEINIRGILSLLLMLVSFTITYKMSKKS